MKKIIYLIAFVFALQFIGVDHASAHCQVPCGIYGDSLRMAQLSEHIQTVEKSMNMINDLSKNVDKNYNQLVRWVNNKDEYANQIQDIATSYFMFQRIHIADNDKNQARNLKMLDALHKLCVYAMKSKQTTDLKNIEMMRAALKEFWEVYHHH